VADVFYLSRLRKEERQCCLKQETTREWETTVLLEEGGTTVLLDCSIMIGIIIFWSASHCLSSLSEPVFSKGRQIYISTSFWICRIWIHAKMDPLFSATEVFQDSHGRLVYVLCIAFIILEFLFVFESKTDFFLRWYCVKELVWLWKGCICFWKEKQLWAESEFMQRFNGLDKFQYRVIGF